MFECFKAANPFTSRGPNAINGVSASVLKKRLNYSKTYAEYLENAIFIDEIQNLMQWRKDSRSIIFDSELIRTRLAHMEAGKSSNIDDRIVFLRAGICSPNLYSRAWSGTKILIQSYVSEVMTEINDISNEIPESVRQNLFADTLAGFGRTALVLAGGGSFGMVHLGVCKALLENALLPKIICGSSVGSLAAAFICIHTDEQLKEKFKKHDAFEQSILDLSAFAAVGSKGSAQRKITRLLKHGYLMDIHVLEKSIRDNIGDATFAEAYEKTGRVLNIAVSTERVHEIPSLLNYLTAPDVVIWSAAAASCSVPGVYEGVPLLLKTDGSSLSLWNPPHSSNMSSIRWKESEFPIKRLSELFSVNNFIVSEIMSTPNSLSDDLISPNLFLKTLNLLYSEFKHRLYQLNELGLLPRSKLISSLIKASLYTLTTPPGSIPDLMVSPSLSWNDLLLYALSNPTEESGRHMIHKGELAVWKNIPAISVRCSIEFLLEKYADENNIMRSWSRSVSPNRSFNSLISQPPPSVQ